MKYYLYELASGKRKGIVHIIPHIILRVCSMLFLGISVVRRFFYRMGIFKSHRLPHTVISVGNLTVGGTGKTPLIEYLIAALRGRRKKVAILTRGYMDQVKDGDEHSDEAAMLRRAYPDAPILAGPNRLQNAQNYLKNNKADVFLLDDGFQHLSISRDLDIVVIDAMNPWGNGYLLPGGTLRELKSTLVHAQIVVLTKTDLGSSNVDAIEATVKSINPKAMIVQTVHEPISFADVRTSELIALDKARGNRAYAISSIGNPDSFRQTLDTLGITVERHLAFMDHHRYTKRDIDQICSMCAQSNLTVVTTDKDAVKIRAFIDDIPQNIQILSLKIRLKVITNEEVFLERVNHIL